MASLFDSNGARRCCPVCGEQLRRADARTCSRPCAATWNMMSPESQTQASKTLNERSQKLWVEFQKKLAREQQQIAGVQQDAQHEFQRQDDAEAGIQTDEGFDINKIIKD